jgi:hypothetical protein
MRFYLFITSKVKDCAGKVVERVDLPAVVVTGRSARWAMAVGLALLYW